MESTICLNAFGYRAEICPERGANMVSLTKGNMRSVRTPSSLQVFWDDNPFLWGVPLLLPPNRISGASFEFEGRTYQFPMNEPSIGNFIHGELHAMPLTCTMHKGSEAEFVYKATKEKPYMLFPHAFTLHVLFSLHEDGMHQIITIQNDSDQNMPFALGFHTTFALPLAEGGCSENTLMKLDVGDEIVRNMDTFLPTGEVITESAFSKALNEGSLKPAVETISRHFAMGDRHELCLTDPELGLRLRYRASENYRYWMIYNGGSKDFICVEPQTWLNNCPNAPFDREKTGFLYLCPGELRTYETVFSLEKI